MVTYAVEPGLSGNLDLPSGMISPLPDERLDPLISIADYRPPRLKMIYSSKVLVVRSSFFERSLTFSAYYFKHGPIQYEYVPMTADAEAFLTYRRKVSLERNMSQFRAAALTKNQRDKTGGLFQLRIPIKSKTMESIFGEGGAGIKVSGYHRITFSGQSQWTDQASTATYRQSKFPSLQMEQESRFDISGTIGTKITVSVSHDSKTDIPLANRIMLRYKGNEDDIIQSIEAGNTTLSLPNTQFVGYSARINGLFGLKTTAQIGALSLTAIASQEKGTTERTSISAGSSTQKTYVRDNNYLDGRIFDLGRIADVQGSDYAENEIDFRPGDTIKYIEIYGFAKVGQVGDVTAPDAIFYIDPLFPTDSAWKNDTVGVAKIDENNYYVNQAEHWVLFDQSFGGTGDSYLGTFMVVKRGPNDPNPGSIDTIGSVTPAIEGDPYVLKLLSPRNTDPSDVTWNYMWRNVYGLGQYNIDIEGLEINLFKGEDGTENIGDNLDNQGGVPYIRILGLDRFNQQGQAVPDGLADVKTNLIDAQRGLLIFPDRFPFATTQTWADTILDPQVPELYNSATAQEKLEASEYYIEITNSSRAAQVSLGRANIIEGSEQITLNGRALVKGTDYNINYDFGQVTFLIDEAVDPNANLNIDFEYAPYIAAEKKTLFGLRAQYEAGSNFKLGSTFLYKSDKATPRKPKVGQETAETIVWDVDGSFKMKPNFITSAVNALPFISTEAPSNLAVSGEFAQSIPNPNVDGVAYVDDFEGSRDAYSLGVFREKWYFSSKPVGMADYRRRARLVWYNPYQQVATDEIWDRELAAGESGTHTLWIEYSPSVLDYRIADVDEDTTFFDPSSSWAGLTKFMTGGATNQNLVQLLEIRLKGDEGIIHFDLGEITEDINGSDSLDTEDTNLNYALDEGEDVGLDGKPDGRETGGGEADDPNDDNWYYNGYGEDCNGCNENDYSHINGTEGNAQDPNRWGYPDSEDINLDRIFSTPNNYFSYSIDLSDDKFLVEGSRNEYGWRTYRIPLQDSLSLDGIIGDPKWTQIAYVRMWLESADNLPFDVKIAALDLVQSNWRDTLLYGEDPDSPTLFSVAVINTQENADIYSPPPGVTGYYDQTTQVTEPEQSLMLTYDSLAYGDTCIAQRFLYDAPNYMGYGALEMFVHGPESSTADSVMYFFRIGQDEENYYAFQDTLQPGWDANGVLMNFDEITGLKEIYQQNREIGDPSPQDTLAGNYRIVGNPTITRVKYLAVGMLSLDSDRLLSGSIWFDEMRLTDVRKDVGIAARLTVSGNVADLFTYSAGYLYKNAYFVGISSSTRAGSQVNLGSGKSTTSYNFSVNMRMDRFLPKSYGASIPVSLRYSKSTTVPRLRFNTDIVLPVELRDSESSVNETKALTVSQKVNKKTTNPFFSLLLNNIKTNFSYTRTEGRSPSAPMSFSENYRFGGSYGLNIRTVPSLRPFFWTQPIPMLSKLANSKFYLFPGSWNFNSDFNRTFRLTENSSGITTNTLQRNFHGSMKITYRISDVLTTNYSMDTQRDLSDPETYHFSFSPKKFRLGLETNYSQAFSAAYDPKVFKFLTHKLNYSVSYRENLNVRDTTRTASSSKSYGVSGSLDLKKLFTVSKPTPRRGLPEVRGNKIIATDDNFIQRTLRPISKVMGFLTSWADPFGYDYSEKFSYTFVGLTERAQMKFRFGLTDEIGAATRSDISSNTSNSEIKTTSYSLRSGTSFFGGIKADVSYSKKFTEDIVKSMNPQKSINTVFPDIRFSIRPLRTFTTFNSIIRTFQPRTNYSRTRGETVNLETGVTTSETMTTAQRPLISFSFNIFRNMQINFNADRSVTESKAFNGLSGVGTKHTKATSTTRKVSTKYSFSLPTGFRLPLFGRIRFKSTMSLSLDVSLQKELSENYPTSINDVTTKLSDRSVLMIVPSISYSFSSQIRGGLSGRWQDTNDRLQSRNSHVRQLQIWVDIRF